MNVVWLVRYSDPLAGCHCRAAGELEDGLADLLEEEFGDDFVQEGSSDSDSSFSPKVIGGTATPIAQAPGAPGTPPPTILETVEPPPLPSAPPPLPPPAEQAGVVVAVGVDLIENVEAAAALLAGNRGAFRLTPKQPGIKKSERGRYGGYQASCPFHQKNKKTGCKRFISFGSNDVAEKRLVFRQLLWWCSQACSFARQRTHLVQPLPRDEVPTWLHLRALRIDERPERGSVKTDAALDKDDAEAVIGSGMYSARGPSVSMDRLVPQVSSSQIYPVLVSAPISWN
jgi:hypothetical protein